MATLVFERRQNGGLYFVPGTDESVPGDSGVDGANADRHLPGGWGKEVLVVLPELEPAIALADLHLTIRHLVRDPDAERRLDRPFVVCDLHDGTGELSVWADEFDGQTPASHLRVVDTQAHGVPGVVASRKEGGVGVMRPRRRGELKLRHVGGVDLPLARCRAVWAVAQIDPPACDRGPDAAPRTGGHVA